MKKVSVIVPVYNVEKYLKKCLDSLVNQTLKDIEIIVINDGSTDNSLNIIKEYKNIKLIDQKNSGIGNARNNGIKNATGEYIAFIDSDDYVDINMFKECYQYASENDLDILVLNYFKLYEDTGNIEEFFIDKFDTTNLKNNKELLFKINSSPWNKLYRRSLFNDKCMRFPEKIKYEDLGLINILLSKANKIGYLNKSFNYYLVRSKSETTTVDHKVYDIFKILDIINNHYKKLKIYDSELEYLNIEKVLTYTISQREQKNKEFRNKFIDDAFKYLDDNFKNWKNNKYYLNRNKLKRLIEKNKWITKLYCDIYNKIKR